MFDESHYVPVLKGLAGEYKALREADGRVRAGVTPLIEVPAVGWNFATETEAKTPGEHVAGVARSLFGSWGPERRVFVDAGLLNPADLVDGHHPLQTVLDAGRELGLLIIPVTGAERGQAYDAAVVRAVGQDRRGVCLRLTGADLEDPDAIGGVLAGVRGPLGLSVSDIDLVVDLGAMGAGGGLAVATVRMVLGSVPQLDAWRSLTLVASSFPLDLSDVDSDSDGTSPREEWRLWRALYSRQGQLLRMPTFGDYGVAHPVPRLLDPRVVNRSAQIRYTGEEDFHLIKGRSIKDNGSAQQHDIARRLVARPEFRGASFSWGDGYIAACARREVGPGNGSTWRSVGTSQHMAFVTEQVARLTGF
jgi:Beta protein